MIHWEWLIVAVWAGLVAGWVSFALCGMSSRNELEEESIHWFLEWLKLQKKLEAYIDKGK